MTEFLTWLRYLHDLDEAFSPAVLRNLLQKFQPLEITYGPASPDATASILITCLLASPTSQAFMSTKNNGVSFRVVLHQQKNGSHLGTHNSVA